MSEDREDNSGYSFNDATDKALKGLGMRGIVQPQRQRNPHNRNPLDPMKYLPLFMKAACALIAAANPSDDPFFEDFSRDVKKKFDEDAETAEKAEGKPLSYRAAFALAVGALAATGAVYLQSAIGRVKDNLSSAFEGAAQLPGLDVLIPGELSNMFRSRAAGGAPRLPGIPAPDAPAPG